MENVDRSEIDMTIKCIKHNFFHIVYCQKRHQLIKIVELILQKESSQLFMSQKYKFDNFMSQVLPIKKSVDKIVILPFRKNLSYVSSRDGLSDSRE